MARRFSRRPIGGGPSGRAVWLVATPGVAALVAVVLAKAWPI